MVQQRIRKQRPPSGCDVIPVSEMDDRALCEMMERMADWIGRDASRSAARRIVRYVVQQRRQA